MMTRAADHLAAGPAGAATIVAPVTDRLAPGVRRERPRRFVPRFHWELLVCGLAGHELVGLGARRLREEDAVVAREIDGVRWHRCLRCDSWLPLGGPPDGDAAARDLPPSREEIELPLRGRPLRDKIILRLIAINRALHFVGLALLAIAILLFSANRADLRDAVLRVVADVTGESANGSGSRHGVTHRIDELFSLRSSRLHLFAAIAIVYAVIEGVEAVGLWYGRRWAEYLTLIVTASLLPVEIYELTNHVSPFKVVAFILNVAVVAYLLYAKRLFGIRGGAAADRAARERDMGWEALEAATPWLAHPDPSRRCPPRSAAKRRAPAAQRPPSAATAAPTVPFGAGLGESVRPSARRARAGTRRSSSRPGCPTRCTRNRVGVAGSRWRGEVGARPYADEVDRLEVLQTASFDLRNETGDSLCHGRMGDLVRYRLHASIVQAPRSRATAGSDGTIAPANHRLIGASYRAVIHAARER
jgi:uncharacterized membrane protein (DUF2068 family)